ncbi:DUF2061 domain-containing protein [Ramlibacter pallidus]|uniref:DUF2061 domain-containing protein n=1 Tax=Ramlibacter pallidus TaxID=2780087 RepID=A0ABR9RXV6_9BURK|nr:DUF2061 domain-containing protein [Ramlibacter pallidus]MBE7366065.1 DUF2061 domain-containing protein [Ramlibacter pallidus]
MRIRTESSLHKTLSFAVIHLAIAVTLGWLFTGGFVLGGLLALIEPAANTVVSHGLETFARNWGGDPRRRAVLKSTLLGVSHFVVAVAVGFALTGSWVAAGAYAVVEPLANAVAHYFFDRWWEGRGEAAPLAA